MGLDVNRVHPGPVDEELVCPICSGVFENPIASPECEHAFCTDCITQWLNRQQTCPVDRQTVQIAQLKPVPRILRNLLARLEVTCENASLGCQAIVKLDHLQNHLKECEHNPKKPVECQQGCGITVPKDEMTGHNCVKELRASVQANKQRVNELQGELGDCKYQLAEQRREISILKDLVRGMREQKIGLGGMGVVPPPPPPPNATHEVSRWAMGLPRARVTRWGGMIATPDAVLQTVIQRALVETGCPDHIVNELMSNAHERRWPPGLLTLETRQMNRRQYEQYVCRRIPNKQAVIVMACDNSHMSDDMIIEPGIVMIFAHGIE